MFTQREEQWTESGDAGKGEYRRRITHEDICHCDGLRRSAMSRHNALRSSSLDWRQSTDHCSGFNDYVTSDPANLWFKNDLSMSRRSRSRQRRCRSYDQLCEVQRCCCCCSCNQQHLQQCRYRSGAVRHHHECCDSWDPMYDSAQFVRSSENIGIVRVVPIAFVSSTAKTSPNFFSGTTESYNENTDSSEHMKAADFTPYYGPFMARKVRINPATVAASARKSHSVQEHYSSERKYLREIQNEEPENTEPLISVKERQNESNDTGTAFGTMSVSDGTAKIACSEFAEIPLAPPAIPRFHIHADSSPSLTTIGEEPEVPKKSIQKSPEFEQNHRESGRETLMEGLELLRHKKKEQERKSLLVKTSFEKEDKNFPKMSQIHPQTPKRSQIIPEESRVKDFATYWSKKSQEKRHHPRNEPSSGLAPLHARHSLQERLQHDTTKTQTIPMNVVNVAPADADDGSSESKFIMEIRRVREKLRKVSKDSGRVASCGEVPEVKVGPSVEEQSKSPPPSPSRPPEILTFYTPQPYVSSQDRKDTESGAVTSSRTFRVTGKTESKQDAQKTALLSTTVQVAPSSTGLTEDKISRYTGQKQESISAEVYIRNPRDSKPAVINVLRAGEETKRPRPRWMILKAYESPPSTLDRNRSRKDSQGTKVQLRSDLTISTGVKKLGSDADSDLQNVVPEAKRQFLERDQVETRIFDDIRSQSRTSLTVRTKADTLIQSSLREHPESDSGPTVGAPTTRHERKVSDASPKGIEAEVFLKTDDNSRIHRTGAFEEYLTLNGRVEFCRRGSPILLTLQHNGNSQILNDISLFFIHDLANYESTIVPVKYNHANKQSKTKWHATYKTLTPNTALLEVFTPSDIPIGLWQMKVKYREGSDLCTLYLCMLCNPWHKDDETYYPNQVELDEYVLNELAVMRKWQRNDAWLLAQFSTVCMDTVLYLLTLCLQDNLLKRVEFGSASAVIKAVAIAISKYVLEVKWNDFQRQSLENGNLPSAWTGSKEIMATYRRTGTRIGYGQSWCYAGLLTSICRCLGVPCRMVTIYNYAPQVDDDMQIKLDLIDDMLAEKSKDTVWHYHMWNELWLQSTMLRDNNRWHVCDATPTSKGNEGLTPGSALFPVQRIKDGDTMRRQNEDEYFGQQLYWMLNANIVCNYYYRDPTTNNPVFAYSKRLKKRISNGLVSGTEDAETNLTNSYKQHVDFVTSRNGNKTQSLPDLLNGTSSGEYEFNLSAFESISIDEPIAGYLTIVSKSLLERTVLARIQVDLTGYTGVVITHVYLFEELLIIQPKQRQKVEFSVPADFFQDIFTEDWNVSITVFARVLHSDERFYTQQVLTLLKPTLSIEKLRSQKNPTTLADEEQFQISVMNPLSMVLTGCEIRIDGTGLLFQDSPILCGTIEKHGTLAVRTTAVRRNAARSGAVVVVFNSDQLKNTRSYHLYH